MIPYQYFLIALVPDPLRNESVNIGIIGICEGKIEYLFLHEFRRIKLIAPDYHISKDPGEEIRKLLCQVPAGQRIDFLSSLDSEFLRISLPAQGIAQSYDAFVAIMEQTYGRLVKPPTKQPKTREKRSRLKTQIKNIFKKKELICEKLSDKKIVPNFTIAASEGLLVSDFAYENGKLNLIETIDFRGSLEKIRGDKFKDTALAVVKIDEARKKINKDASGHLLYMPPEDEGITIQAHCSLLKDYYYDNVYNYSNKDERERFFSRVEKDLGFSFC